MEMKFKSYSQVFILLWWWFFFLLFTFILVKFDFSILYFFFYSGHKLQQTKLSEETESRTMYNYRARVKLSVAGDQLGPGNLNMRKTCTVYS